MLLLPVLLRDHDRFCFLQSFDKLALFTVDHDALLKLLRLGKGRHLNCG